MNIDLKNTDLVSKKTSRILFFKKEKSIINIHYHPDRTKKIKTTSEVLFIKKGKIKVSIFNLKKVLICNKILKTGDIIMLARCAHGFKILKD